MKIRLLAGLLALGLAAGCGGATVETAPSSTASAGTATASGAAGTVKIAINPWVGYEASANVVAYLLKNELGYQVELP